MTDQHEIEIKRAGKRVALLTVHTEDSMAALEVKENLEAGYPKEDGYTVLLHRVETTRSRIICAVGSSVFRMPKEGASA